jgi:alpha-1,3-mannosyltransferase
VGTVPRLLLCALWQVGVAVPFLQVDAWAYITRSFDLGRQFFHVWSVNLKFLPEEIFLRKELGLALLAANLFVVLWFAHNLWCRSEKGLMRVMTRLRGSSPSLSPQHVIWVLFTSNFIGIVFARSLHFQFYVWYFHALPFLLWSVQTGTILRILLLLAIEYVWNVYPSNARSSALLVACHVGVLCYLATRVDPLFLHAKPERRKRE